MTEVLMYNIDDSKRLKIKLLCNKLNIRSREVEKSEFGLKISTLLGLDDDKTVKPDSDFDGEMLYLELKKRGILVRHFTKERIRDYNRITIGTRQQMETLAAAIEEILKEQDL